MRNKKEKIIDKINKGTNISDTLNNSFSIGESESQVKEKNLNFLEFLESHLNKRVVSFYMPGHKGFDFFEKMGYGKLLKKMPNYDITEIIGADNLFAPTGIIKDMEDRYKKIYGSKETFLLVNGSTVGILAGLMSSLSQGDLVLIGDNSHQAVINGISLSKCKYKKIKTRKLGEYGIEGEILYSDAEKVIKENKGAKAILITSPNYYGFVSDIEKIANLAHENDMILIVDAAHGAHFTVFSPRYQEELKKADIVIASTHKTMASFTQSGILNIYSDRAKRDLIEKNLRKLQSSSPSYLLMLSLYINLEIMEARGEFLGQKWNKDIDCFLKEAKELKALRILEEDNLDKSKINITVNKEYLPDMTGKDIEKFLEEKNIFLEMSSQKIALAMTGIGSKKEDYRVLLKALKELDNKILAEGKEDEQLVFQDVVNVKDIPNEQNLWGKSSLLEIETVYFEEAEGMVLAENITPYPPGVPLAIEGEVCDIKVLQIAYDMLERGRIVLGMRAGGLVSIYKE